MPDLYDDTKPRFPLKEIASSGRNNGNNIAELARRLDELEKANEEIKSARRAALNLMEDAILSKEALRKSEEKYRSLFNSIDEGFHIIELIYGDDGKAIDFRYLETNQSFEQHTGLKDAAGKPGSEIAPNTEDYWFEAYENVARTGEPIRFENYNQFTGRWYSAYAFRVLQESTSQVAVLFNDITERKLREKQQEYLLKLSDATRSMDNPIAIEEIATHLAMDHFAADRCYYCMIEEGNAIIKRDALRGDLPSVCGTYPLSSFAIFKTVVDEGRPFIVDDVNTTDLLDEPLREICIKLNIISFIDVPVIKNGKAIGIFCLVQSTPRKWKQTEIELGKETAERTWEAVERARVEQALKQRERELARVQEIGNIGGVDIDVVNNLKADRSPEYLRLHGLPPDTKSETHEDWLLRLHPDDRESAEKVLLDTLNSPQSSYESEYRIIRPNDKQVRWIYAKLDIERNVKGHPLRMVGVHIDITLRKKAEEALRHSEERFRTLADAIPQIIWTNNADGEASYFNKRWYEYTGLNYEQSAGPGWRAIVHPDDAPASVERWEKALAAGEVFDVEYRLRGQNRSYCWFIGRNVPLRDEAGKITSWFGSATDIGDLKRAQDALRASEERMQITMESAVDFAIITMNPERIIEQWNTGAEKIFGYKADEAEGNTADIIFTEEDQAAGVPEKEMRSAREKGYAEDERWHKRKDGSKFYVSGVMRPIYNPELTGYVKIARDMTQQKLIEQQKDDFIGIASHELKTPVTSIKAYTELLLETVNEPVYNETDQIIVKLDAQVDRLIELIHVLLDTTRLAEGQLTLSLSDFDINELVAERIEALQPTSGNHLLNFTTDKTPLFTYADKERLGEVLNNFISNAIKYSPKGGEIKITAAKTEGGIQVSVQDKGIGIPAEAKGKVFERFYRVRDAHIDTYPGMGLGLYIAAAIIKKHRGKIWVESMLNQGSTFCFFLPDKNNI